MAAAASLRAWHRCGRRVIAVRLAKADVRARAASGGGA